MLRSTVYQNNANYIFYSTFRWIIHFYRLSNKFVLFLSKIETVGVTNMTKYCSEKSWECPKVVFFTRLRFHTYMIEVTSIHSQLKAHSVLYFRPPKFRTKNKLKFFCPVSVGGEHEDLKYTTFSIFPDSTVARFANMAKNGNNFIIVIPCIRLVLIAFILF